METNENSTYQIWVRAMGTSWHGNEFLATVQELKLSIW